MPTPDDPKPVGNASPPAGHQFKPGQSGNPAGRPRGCLSLKNRVKAVMERAVREGGDKTIADLMAEAIVLGALDSSKYKGDVRLMQLAVAIEGSAKAPEDDGPSSAVLLDRAEDDLNKVYGDPDPTVPGGGQGGGVPA